MLQCGLLLAAVLAALRKSDIECESPYSDLLARHVNLRALATTSDAEYLHRRWPDLVAAVQGLDADMCPCLAQQMLKHLHSMGGTCQQGRSDTTDVMKQYQQLIIRGGLATIHKHP